MNEFKKFLTARIAVALAYQIFSVAIGWQVYYLTDSTFYLGLVGLIQFLPMVTLTLVVGYVADNFDRRKIASICQIIEGTCVLVIAMGNFGGWISIKIIMIVIFVMASSHTFQNPATQSLLPNIVSKDKFPRAAALAASGFQSSVIIGPAIGGFLYVFSPGCVYLISGILCLISSILIFNIKLIDKESKNEKVVLTPIQSVLEGLKYIWSKPIILGAISLDLFAVMFGGATALLPVYASKILHIGSFGLGILRAAPAIGALIVSLYIAKNPLNKNIGRKMFIAVVIFGLSTIVFGLSKIFIISLIALIVMGAADVVSVVIRSTLVQLETPDEMRGRVSSVNFLFIGTSNQFGEFESGVTASAFGVVQAVVIGGCGTLIVVGLWTKLFPSLYKADKLVNRI